jgi:hypothetical protein
MNVAITVHQWLLAKYIINEKGNPEKRSRCHMIMKIALAADIKSTKEQKNSMSYRTTLMLRKML